MSLLNLSVAPMILPNAFHLPRVYPSQLPKMHAKHVSVSMTFPSAKQRSHRFGLFGCIVHPPFPATQSMQPRNTCSISVLCTATFLNAGKSYGCPFCRNTRMRAFPGIQSLALAITKYSPTCWKIEVLYRAVRVVSFSPFSHTRVTSCKLGLGACMRVRASSLSLLPTSGSSSSPCGVRLTEFICVFNRLSTSSPFSRGIISSPKWLIMPMVPSSSYLKRSLLVTSPPSRYGNFTTDSSTTAGMVKNRTVLISPPTSLPVTSFTRKQNPCGFSAFPPNPDIAFALSSWNTLIPLCSTTSLLIIVCAAPGSTYPKIFVPSTFSPFTLGTVIAGLFFSGRCSTFIFCSTIARNFIT